MSIITSSWAEKAWLPLLVGLAIPILAGLLQWISTKLMPTQATDTTNNDNNAMASSMKTMNTVMPLMSVFFCFTFSAGMGIYWVAGSLIRCVTQIIANKHMAKIDVEEMIKKNLEKYNEKRAKQGLRPENISNVARQNIKNMNAQSEEKEQSEESRQKQQEKRLKNIQESTEYYNNTAKPGSLAAKARMVQQYNEKNTKKK